MNVSNKLKRPRRFANKTKMLAKFSKPLIILSILWVGLSPAVAIAQSNSDYQRKINNLDAQIARNQATLNGISHEADTLENKLNAIEAEIASLQASIDKANLQIAQTRQQIAAALKELEGQKKIMFENARVLYKMGDPTTIEILASSDNFTDFINRQEYLETVKDAVNKAAQQIISLRDRLEAKQKELEEFVKQQEIQKQIVDNKRAEQAELLALTRGEEARYQARSKELKAQRAAAEAQLLAGLRSGSIRGGDGSGTAVKADQVVTAGQTLGYVGDSGYAEGPHLHFALIQGGSYTDPGPYLNSGVEWPVPGFHDITQPYGCVQNQYYQQGGCQPGWSFHRGLDIGAPYGAKIVATEAGKVTYSGCWSGSGFGNVVIVDHPGGKQTYYPHMGSGCQ